MNCLEFRRLQLTSPRTLPPAVVEHLRVCLTCSGFAKITEALEVELERAIHVPVDATLAQRVLLNHQLNRSRPRRVLALAAAVLLAFGISLIARYEIFAPGRNLASASIEHALREPAALQARQKVSDAQLGAALEFSGAALKGGLAATVTYLHDCPLPGGMGKHMVLQTALGQVTLITMPQRSVTRRTALRAEGRSSVVLPAARGSYAVVADSEQSLAAAEKLLSEQIIWAG